MLVDIRITFASFFSNTFKKDWNLLLRIWWPRDGRPLAGCLKKKKSKSWDEYEAQNFFSNMIAFEKGFFFDRRAGRVHSSIKKKFPYILLEFNSGFRILSSKFQTFLKVFEKNDGKVILMSTNIIMGQLNIKDYEYDNGITIFWLCENLRTHFRLRLFDQAFFFIKTFGTKKWKNSENLVNVSHSFQKLCKHSQRFSGFLKTTKL